MRASKPEVLRLICDADEFNALHAWNARCGRRSPDADVVSACAA